jgi:hypothetical protein
MPPFIPEESGLVSIPFLLSVNRVAIQSIFDAPKPNRNGAVDNHLARPAGNTAPASVIASEFVMGMVGATGIEPVTPPV